MLTEDEAWRYLKNAWSQDTQRLGMSTFSEILLSGAAHGYVAGLCESVKRLYVYNSITKATKISMIEKINQHRNWLGIEEGYLWPLDAHGAKCRAEFCQQQYTNLVA